MKNIVLTNFNNPTTDEAAGNKRITAVIIDDDSNLRGGLVQMLQFFAPEISILGEAETVDEGVQLIHNTSPTVVFLDIQLASGTGFDIIETYKKWYGNPKFHVVFITAHEQYALKAFRFSALDFLLKPVDPSELKQVLEKIKKQSQNNFKNIEVLLEHISKKNDNPKRIALANNDGVHLFEIKDIIRCESDSNYTTFYSNNHKPVITSKSLKEYEDLLTEHNFERIHQSHLINLNYLKSYIKKDGGYVVMADNSKLPLSQRKKERLQTIINHLLE
jgi:two-component system, LytTR family, response regulator